MTALREAAQQALKSLEDAINEWAEEMEFRSCVSAADAWIESADTLRDALAHPAPEPEPVAWMVYTLDGKSAFVTDNPKDFTQDHRALPLYTHPPQRKPLTDEEILEAWKPFEGNPFTTKYEFARAIERAHGIGAKR